MIRKLIPAYLITLLQLNFLFCDLGDDFVSRGKGENELTTSEYINIVRPFLPDNPNILEAGAHSGEDTWQFAKAWPKGQVFAFEPVPTFYGRILDKLKEKKITNALTYPIGLFSVSGDQPFYYSQNCGGASSFLPEGTVESVNYDDKEIVVPCMILDQWAEKEQVDHIDFMWLDMEGAEYYMLSSSPKILDTTKVILTELSFRNFREGHTQYHVLKPFLENHGFTLHKIWGSATWQATGMFVKTDLLLNTTEL